jgi:hypothetical protein
MVAEARLRQEERETECGGREGSGYGREPQTTIGKSVRKLFHTIIIFVDETTQPVLSVT